MFRSVRSVRVFVLPLVAVMASACYSSSDTTSASSLITTPTVTSPTAGLVSATETFNGTLVSGATNLHTFHVMPGPVKVTLASLDPSTAPPLVGLAIGMWDGLSCVAVLQTSEAVPGTVLAGTSSIDASVCVKVWDPGTLAADSTLTYQVSAVHNEKPQS
jgi:hypothetical protein